MICLGWYCWYAMKLTPSLVDCTLMSSMTNRYEPVQCHLEPRLFYSVENMLATYASVVTTFCCIMFRNVMKATHSITLVFVNRLCITYHLNTIACLVYITNLYASFCSLLFFTEKKAVNKMNFDRSNQAVLRSYSSAWIRGLGIDVDNRRICWTNLGKQLSEVNGINSVVQMCVGISAFLGDVTPC